MKRIIVALLIAAFMLSAVACGNTTPTTTDPVTTEAPATDAPATDAPAADADVYTVAAGNYAGAYTKESAMAGTVVYNYSATVGADGAFSYSVKFAMSGQDMDGASATGTYKIDGDKFIFTDSEGTVTEGKITAENTVVISLKASAMATSPYEITLTLSK